MRTGLQERRNPSLADSSLEALMCMAGTTLEADPDESFMRQDDASIGNQDDGW